MSRETESEKLGTGSSREDYCFCNENCFLMCPPQDNGTHYKKTRIMIFCNEIARLAAESARAVLFKLLAVALHGID